LKIADKRNVIFFMNERFIVFQWEENF